MDAKALLQQHPDFEAMEERFELPRDLLGNTRSMQDATVRWLFREEAESDDAYNQRLRRSTLYNPFGQVIDQASARPFRNPVTIAEDASLEGGIAEFPENVDLEGRSLTQFARDLTKDSMGFGLSMFLVEWNAFHDRAYWKHLEPGSVYHWRQDRESLHLSDVRFRLADTREKPDTGELEEVDVVWRYFKEEGRVRWERYITSDQGEKKAELEDEGELLNRSGAPLEEIPLVVIYANRVRSMVGWPPYERLADLNWRHWQAYSGLSNLLRYVTIPILLRKGVEPRGSGASDTDGKHKQAVTISATSVIDIPADADMEFVEIQGKAVESAEKDLEGIERKMEAEGATPVIRAGVQTATRSIIDDQSREAGMTAYVRALESGLTEGLKRVFEWNAIEAPAELAVQVNEDRPLNQGRENRAKLVMEAQKNGLITGQTAIVELQRDQILSEEVDPEIETARVARVSRDLVDDLETFPDRDDEFASGDDMEGEG